MSDIPKKMSGVYLTGHGGLEKLVYKEDIPVLRLSLERCLLKLMVQVLITPISILV